MKENNNNNNEKKSAELTLSDNKRTQNITVNESFVFIVFKISRKCICDFIPNFPVDFPKAYPVRHRRVFDVLVDIKWRNSYVINACSLIIFNVIYRGVRSTVATRIKRNFVFTLVRLEFLS